MFGKKVKEIEEEPKKEIAGEPVEEKADLEVDMEELKGEPEPAKTSEKETKEEPVEDYMRIVSGELMSNGVYKYIIVSNKSLGEIGAVFKF